MRGLDTPSIVLTFVLTMLTGCHPGWYTARIKPESAKGTWIGLIETTSATSPAVGNKPARTLDIPVLLVESGPALHPEGVSGTTADVQIGGRRAAFVDRHLKVRSKEKYPIGKRVEVSGKMVARGINDDRGNALDIDVNVFALESNRVRVLD
jgi:hypothetical protein